MTFEEWSNKKKKKSSSFEEWSNANRSISKEQEEEDERKRKEYLSSRKNDDIAPVKEEKKTDRESTFKSSSGKTHGGGGGNFGKTTAEENRTWFKEGEGSVWERILGSMTDAGENVSSGFIGIGEKVVDAMTTMGAVMNRSNMMKAAESEILLNTLSGKESEGVFDKYQKKQEEWEKEVGDFVAKDLYDEEKIVKSGTKAVAEKILNEPMRKVVLDEEKYSVFGDKSDALAQSAGQLGGQLAVSAIPGVGQVGGMALLGATAFGSEAEGAFREGANLNEAVLSSAISAGAEILSERLGGVKFGGKTLTDVAFNKLSGQVTSKLAKVLVSAGKIGADAVAEGGEELFSGYMSAVGQKLTYMEDKEIEELFSDEDKLESFIGGVVLGGTFGTVETAVSGRDAATGLSKSEQAVVDKVVNDTIAEQESEGKTLTNREKTKIRESVVDQMEKGQIDIDTIESVLGGDEYKRYTYHVNSQQRLKNELEELSNIKAGELTRNQQKRLEELEGMDFDDTHQQNVLRKKLDNKLSPMLKDSKLTESYREKERRGQTFEADLSKYKGKQREAVERAINSGVLNNTYRSHELVDVLSKIEADKGISFDYTNNAKLKESGFAVEGKTVNGYANKAKGSVTLNVQSSKAWQSVVGHEITHILEGTDSYSALQNALYEYAESKGELTSRRDALTNLYSGMDADIENELTADLVGDYLFTDKEFINKLTGNRTLFEKVYDEIKYLWNAATGKEKNEIEKVKREFDKVWKELSVEAKEADGKVQLSVSEIVDENNNSYGTGVKLDSTLLDDLTPGERVEMVKERVKELGGKPFTAYDGNGNAVNVMIAEAKAKFKNKNGKIIPVNKDLTTKYIDNETKQEAVVLADELILTAKYEDSKAPMYPHGWLDNNGKNNWEYWTTYVQDKNNTIWQATLNIATTADGEKILYDVSPIKKAGRSVKSDTLPADNSIAPLPENVNTQFSLSSDTNGNNLSKEQQEYFKDSKVVDENGNLKVMYHGTPSGDFTVFRDGTYFTENKWYADLYQNPGASSINSRKTVTNPKTYEVYLDIKKPFDISDPEARDIYINDYIKGGNATGINPYLSDAEYAKINSIDWTEGEDLRDFLIDNEYDYDGLVLDEGAVGGYGDDVKYRGKSYVIFSPEQVKEVGNKNPTSDPDIRFSLSSAVEETKDLMALHNLHTSELLETLKLNGLPSPSVAIVKAKDGHEKYGDVSLILPKETIDPQVNKANRIYGSDAWTPTRSNAQVEYEVNYDAQRKFEKEVEQLSNNVANGVFSKSSVLGMAGIEGTTDKNLNEIAEKISGYDAVQAAYVAEMGGDVEVVYREKEFDSYGNKVLKRYIDNVGEQEVARLAAKMLTGERLSAEEVETAKDAIVEDWTAKKEYALKRKPELREERIAKFRDGLSDIRVEDFIGHAWDFYENTGATTEEIDRNATGENLRNAASRSDVEAWVADKLQGLLGEPGIYNGKDPFTPSGKQRSFSETHWDYTLENIVRAMNNADTRGANMWNVSGEAIMATATPEYKTIDDVRADKDRLYKADDDYYEQIKSDITSELQTVTSDIIKTTEHHSDNQYDEEQIVGRVIMEAAQGKKTVADVKRVFSKNGYRIGDAQAESVLSLFERASSVPTGYFEAKPQRAVGLDEVGVFVIPRNADVKLKQELLNRGYNIAEYDPDVEGDRQRVVNNFEEYKFSLSNVGEESAPVGNYSTPLKDLALEEDIAPVTENVAPTTDAPFPNEIAPMTEEEANAIQDEKANADAAAEGLPKSRKQLHNNIINDTKATFSSNGFDFDDVLAKAKNLSTFSTVDNTPQRVMEKALGYKQGQVLADLTVNKVAQNETAGIKWLNSFTDRKNGVLAQLSRQYRIKPGSKESAAAQMYAEGFYVNDNNDIIAYGDAELAKDFPNEGVQNRIKGLAHDPVIRKIYDETLNAINDSRTRNAYPEIQRLENYFLHFRAMDDTFSKLGLPFNPNDIRAKDLPTDLNGVTADLKPGQPYFASAMHRTGKRTSFDLLGGLERYLTSAKNQIYHIDDIQMLRALRNYIADTYGQANGLEGIDALTEEEAQEKIEQVYGSHLSTFAKFLNEEANVLAGKTALIDRGLEGIIGRRGMTFLDTVNRQVGSNMVGFNISSSLTNFLPVAQTLAKAGKFDFTKAFAQTVSNKITSIFGKSDGFTENSPVVIRRKGADRFYRTPWQKAGDAGYLLMSAVDDVSTELIARTKYNELTRKGMDEQTAHFETDKWVSRLMGDRSLGQQPQLYNSKTLGVLTKFQLEVRNQLDSQFYDTIQEAKVSNEDIQNALARNAKTAAKVTSTFAQLAVVQHLYGKAFESVAGYNPAFDIISTLATMFGYDDDEESEDTVLDNIEQGFLELLEDLPYTSTFTGGRIPISSALPITELIKGVDQYGNEKSRLETIKEAAPYYVLPGGYGQIKKTKAGLDMFSDEFPVSGSYTDSGKLRFPVEDTPLNRVQAAVFGQYASQNAREYFDNDYAPLNEKQIQEYIDVDIPISEYRDYREGLKGLETNEEKFDYISGLDLPTDKKNILVNNVVDRKESVDLENYEDFSDYEEFDFATKNPEKWNFLQENGISYDAYNESEETREAYNWAYKNPEGYTVAKAITEDVITYRQYTSDLYDIKADKDENGKSINGSRKEKVLDYINNLDADYYTKIVLWKSEYPSDDTYNSEIVDFVNNHSGLSYEERVTILSELGFRVDEKGNIYAD